MSADGMNFVAGSPHCSFDANGANCTWRRGNVRSCACSPSTDTWDQLGNFVVRDSHGHGFGAAVSTSSDGRTIAAGTPNSNGIVRMFMHNPTTDN